MTSRRSDDINNRFAMAFRSGDNVPNRHVEVGAALHDIDKEPKLNIANVGTMEITLVVSLGIQLDNTALIANNDSTTLRGIRTGRYSEQMGHVMTEILNSQPKNSAKVYDPKVLEFKGYCESLYGRPPESHFITVEKTFGFLYYQSYRQKKRSEVSNQEDLTVKISMR